MCVRFVGFVRIVFAVRIPTLGEGLRESVYEFLHEVHRRHVFLVWSRVAMQLTIVTDVSMKMNGATVDLDIIGCGDFDLVSAVLGRADCCELIVHPMIVRILRMSFADPLGLDRRLGWEFDAFQDCRIGHFKMRRCFT